MCLQDASTDLQGKDLASAVGGIQRATAVHRLQEALQVRLLVVAATDLQEANNMPAFAAITSLYQMPPGIVYNCVLLAGHCMAAGIGNVF
jgi:hypothetical protein